MLIFKWTSLAVIFILANIAGHGLAKKYVYREKELKEFKIALNIIKNKIKYTKEPIITIFSNMQNSLETQIKGIFQNAVKEIQNNRIEIAWKNGVEANNKNNLNREDIEIIKSFGNMLGKTDVEGQLSQIDITESFIDKQIRKAEEERKKNEKMYKTLGAITGVGIVILLI